MFFINMLLTFVVAVAVEEQKGVEQFTFAVIPKNTKNAFFDVVRRGCEAEAKALKNVECLYIGPDQEDANAQAEIILNLVKNKSVNGIALSVSDEDVANKAILEARNAGIPVITFDSDSPESKRMTYIGTNNTAFGEALGKVLLQIDSNGGKFGIVSASAPNLVERVAGLRARMNLHKSNWVEVDESPLDCGDDVETALKNMHELAKNPDIRAIIPVGGWPMYNSEGWQLFVDEYRHRDLTVVVGDALDVQIELLNMGYVDGLVGQLQYQMGTMSMQTLYDIVNGKTVQKEIYGTKIMEIISVPLDLPEAKVDTNYIGTLRIMGYVLFSIIALTCIGFTYWVVFHRKHRVVRASQPSFLIMICIGTLILGCTIIPLTIDDEKYGQRACDAGCMSVPWLLFLGFTIAFSALFSKTWRTNKIFHNANKFKRVKVREMDVIVPFVCLFVANIVVLTCWTVFDPYEYRRTPYHGTDGWNRVISTYGTCVSVNGNNADRPYLIALSGIAFVVLITANRQAYQARSIKTQYSESRYIAIVISSLLQVLIISVPVYLIVEDSPRARFVVSTLVVFVACMVVVLFIFLPKLYAMKIFEQKKKRMRANRYDAKGSHRRLSLGDNNSLLLSSGVGGLNFRVVDGALRSEISQVDDIRKRSKRRVSFSDYVSSQYNCAGVVKTVDSQEALSAVWDKPVRKNPLRQRICSGSAGSCPSDDTVNFRRPFKRHSFQNIAENTPTDTAINGSICSLCKNGIEKQPRLQNNHNIVESERNMHRKGSNLRMDQNIIEKKSSESETEDRDLHEVKKAGILVHHSVAEKELSQNEGKPVSEKNIIIMTYCT